MKVYLLCRCERYEGYNTEGVFATVAAARASVNVLGGWYEELGTPMAKAPPNYPNQAERHRSWYEIHTYEVQE